MKYIKLFEEYESMNLTHGTPYINIDDDEVEFVQQYLEPGKLELHGHELYYDENDEGVMDLMRRLFPNDNFPVGGDSDNDGNFEANIIQTLEPIFNPIVGDNFEVDIMAEELADGIECYVDISGYDNWDEVYPLIQQANNSMEQLGAKMGSIILSDEGMGDEVVKKTIDEAQKYSNNNDVTTIRVWYEF